MAVCNLVFVLCLQHCIDDLNLQVDQFESEIEVLMAKKKKLDRGVSENSLCFSCVVNHYACRFNTSMHICRSKYNRCPVLRSFVRDLVIKEPSFVFYIVTNCFSNRQY